jgi:predicted  nucleic acid-binding Zn-ribbon protein
MKATINEQNELYHLQEIDIKIAKIKYEIANLPEQLEINKLKNNDNKETLVIQNTELKDTKLNLHKTQNDLDKVNGDKDKNNLRIKEGNLSANELMFVQDDIKRQVHRQRDLQKKIEDIQKTITLQTQKIIDTENEIAQNSKKVEELELTVKEKSEAIEKSILELEKQKKDINLSDELKELYRVHTVEGVAVAKLIDNQCSGCNMIQPPAYIDKIKDIQNNEIIFCEECDRILIK